MKDQRIEQWLRRFNLSYEYVEELPLAAIIVDKDAKENIRMTERRDDELVIRYGVALQNGDQFPGIVVFIVQSNGTTTTYGLIAGWHRTDAFQLADRKTIPAYIVKVTDKLLIQVLRRTSNTLEGKPPTMAEMLEHAAFLARQGYSIRDASRLMSVPEGRLQDRMLYEQVRMRLAGMEVDLTSLSVPYSGLVRLGSLRDRHLKEVVLLAHEARLPSDRVQQLGREVREARSDEDADRVVQEWRINYTEEIQRSRSGTVRDPASPLRRLPAVFKNTERLLQQHRDKAVALRPQEIKAMKAACRKLISELESMVKHLEEVEAHA